MKNAPFKISPDERIAMIRGSLRCLGYGTASAAMTLGVPIAAALVLNVHHGLRVMMMLVTLWIPLGSILFATVSWVNVMRAQKAQREEWNPAARQMLWGRVLSALGVLISLLLIGFFICVKLFAEE